MFVAARLVLAAIFLWAAYTKLRDPWMIFAMEIDAMHVVPGAMDEAIARTLPWFELALGVLLIVGLQMRVVASMAAALLATFFCTLLVLYLRGFQGDCGCFGAGEQLGPKTLARDGALVALAAWVAWESFRRKKQAPVATI